MESAARLETMPIRIMEFFEAVRAVAVITEEEER